LDSKSIEAVATATTEVAKTSSKAIDAATRLGGFVGDLILEPLRERVAIWTDNLKARRAENLIDLQLRFQRKLDSVQGTIELRQIPWRVGVPLIEAGTIEEEPELRDRWASLLANFARADSGVSINKSFVTVLSELSPLEVRILEKIYTLPEDVGAQGSRGVLTGRLPEVAALQPEGWQQISELPTSDVQLALSNLVRLGLLVRPSTWGCGEALWVVFRCLFGIELVRACTSPSQRAEI
jgi:hypothetical protein